MTLVSRTKTGAGLMIGRNEDGIILILDNGWAATKLPSGEWLEGIRFLTMNEIFNGSFADIEPRRSQDNSTSRRKRLSANRNQQFTPASACQTAA